MANSLKENLEGKYVLLSKEVLRPVYHANEQRLVKVEGGFGADPKTAGRALLVTFVVDGERTRFDGFDVERLVSNEEAEEIMGGPFEIPEDPKAPFLAQLFPQS